MKRTHYIRLAADALKAAASDGYVIAEIAADATKLAKRERRAAAIDKRNSPAARRARGLEPIRPVRRAR